VKCSCGEGNLPSMELGLEYNSHPFISDILLHFDHAMELWRTIRNPGKNCGVLRCLLKHMWVGISTTVYCFAHIKSVFALTAEVTSITARLDRLEPGLYDYVWICR
jgi:hypothetical protein